MTSAEVTLTTTTTGPHPCRRLPSPPAAYLETSTGSVHAAVSCRPPGSLWGHPPRHHPWRLLLPGADRIPLPAHLDQKTCSPGSTMSRRSSMSSWLSRVTVSLCSHYRWLEADAMPGSQQPSLAGLAWQSRFSSATSPRWISKVGQAARPVGVLD